jgi:hypothetical protein
MENGNIMIEKMGGQQHGEDGKQMKCFQEHVQWWALVLIVLNI